MGIIIKQSIENNITCETICFIQHKQAIIININQACKLNRVESMAESNSRMIFISILTNRNRTELIHRSSKCQWEPVNESVVHVDEARLCRFLNQSATSGSDWLSLRNCHSALLCAIINLMVATCRWGKRERTGRSRNTRTRRLYLCMLLVRSKGKHLKVTQPLDWPLNEAFWCF